MMKTVTCQLNLTPMQLTQVGAISLSFTVENPTRVTVNPANVCFDAAPGPNVLDFNFHDFIMVDIAANDDLIEGNLIAPNCFVGEAFQLETEEVITRAEATVKLKDETVIENACIIVGENSVSKTRPLDLKCYREAFNVKITVKKGAQASLFLLYDPNETSQTAEICHSIALFHSEEDKYCTVYRDITHHGVWNSDERVKLGFFSYKNDVPYNLLVNIKNQDVVVMVNAGSDELSCGSTGELKTFSASLPGKSAPVVKGVFAQTYLAGIFEVEDLIDRAFKENEKMGLPPPQ